MTIEMPKRGSTPSDMVSWGGHVCLLYETREEAHLPGRRGH
jgi:hypothetical protein